MKNPRIILLIISITLFVFSLPMKTYCVDNDCGDYFNGLGALLVGFLGILFEGGAAIAWLANPLIIIAWVLPIRWIGIKFISGCIAIFFALYFLTFDEILKNEAGHMGTITGYASGYWFWTSSMIIYTLGLIYIYFQMKKSVINE